MDASFRHMMPSDHQRLTGLFILSLALLCLLIDQIDFKQIVGRLSQEISLQVQLETVAPPRPLPEDVIAEPVSESIIQPESPIEEAPIAEELAPAAQDASPVQLPLEEPTSAPVSDQSVQPAASIRLNAPVISSAQILGSLNQYSLNEPDFEFLHAIEPFETTLPISRMISLTAEDVLSSNLPRLPLADGELNIRFYPSGFTGAVQRNWDKITPEFGFTTAQGIKVRCKLLLSIVACGWK